ncbi:MAG: hypothetical protein ACI4SB_10390, partial [Acutalibacteraceae bacterium]
ITKKAKKFIHKADKSDYKATEIDFPVEMIIQAVIKIPNVKISRNTFLSEQFKETGEEHILAVIKKGPVDAGYTREELKKKAVKLIQIRTTQAFIGDIPEEVSKSTSISDDTLIFYSAAVRLIQEIAYLYGESEFWNTDDFDADKTIGRLNLCYSVMSGSSKATKALKLLSSSASSKSFNKITENIIEKTVYNPIIKPAAKTLGVKMHKTVYNRFVSKAVSVAGNTISQGLTLASLYPMANKLIKTLGEAQFEYSTYDFEADWYDITNESQIQQETAEILPNK